MSMNWGMAIVWHESLGPRTVERDACGRPRLFSRNDEWSRRAAENRRTADARTPIQSCDTRRAAHFPSIPSQTNPSYSRPRPVPASSKELSNEISRFRSTIAFVSTSPPWRCRSSSAPNSRKRRFVSLAKLVVRSEKYAFRCSRYGRGERYGARRALSRVGLPHRRGARRPYRQTYYSMTSRS